MVGKRLEGRHPLTHWQVCCSLTYDVVPKQGGMYGL